MDAQWTEDLIKWRERRALDKLDSILNLAHGISAIIEERLRRDLDKAEDENLSLINEKINAILELLGDC